MTEIKKLRKPLGRGLSALISSPSVQTTPEKPTEFAVKSEIIGTITPAQANNKNSILYVPITQLARNEAQPRTEFKQPELQELAESIKQHGVIQPIIVRQIDKNNEQYQIVAGERRWRAATLAGLKQVPVILKDLPDKDTLEIALIENIQRQNLNAAEEARAYQALMDEFSMSQQEVADKVGKSRSAVANFIRILNLVPEVLTMLEQGDISLGHAKALLTIKEPAAQLNLAKKILSESLSVRALEEIVDRSVQIESRGKTKNRIAPAVGYSDLENRLKNLLGTKVKIRTNKKGTGSIQIEYYSEAELGRIIELVESK